MRNFIVLIALMVSRAVVAQEWEDRQIFNDAASVQKLRIISSTDTELFAPIIEAFVGQNLDVQVDYMVTGTADIDRRFRETPAAFDIVISSAMDLQLKLTNDGYARKLVDISHPSWANWRQSLFAFTSEPAAIVINKLAFKGHPIPKSRQDLIEALRARPEVFQNRVGTYDVRQSGLGYLFATQDARATETFWRLMEVIGSLEAKLYCCSGAMIDDLTDGTIAVAYNVLGSYAEARAGSESALEIILPSDFPTTMMRTAFVSANSKEAEVAQNFIRFLVNYQSNAATKDMLLPPLQGQQFGGERATIALEPALMTFLDELKRKKFLTEWESALIQD